MIVKIVHLEKMLFGEIVFDDNFREILRIQDVKENNDVKNAKIYKIYKDINDVTYIGSACFLLKKCLSNFKTKSKSRVNWAHDNFYDMVHCTNNVHIELIENFPCDNANNFICKNK